VHALLRDPFVAHPQTHTCHSLADATVKNDESSARLHLHDRCGRHINGTTAGSGVCAPLPVARLLTALLDISWQSRNTGRTVERRLATVANCMEMCVVSHLLANRSHPTTSVGSHRLGCERGLSSSSLDQQSSGPETERAAR